MMIAMDDRANSKGIRSEPTNSSINKLSAMAPWRLHNFTASCNLAYDEDELDEEDTDGDKEGDEEADWGDPFEGVDEDNLREKSLHEIEQTLGRLHTVEYALGHMASYSKFKTLFALNKFERKNGIILPTNRNKKRWGLCSSFSFPVPVTVAMGCSLRGGTDKS